ncbi:hypothetical protein ACXPWS_16270 [Mycobacterium sp. BMJ-28]
MDAIAADKLRVIGKVTNASEAKLVEKGLDMVLLAADNNKTALRQQLLAQYEAATRLLDSDWANQDTAPGEPAAAEPTDEVPPGDTMFQGKVDLGVAQRLQAVARVQGRNDSGLVRHGLKLVIDEADANMRVLLKKLERDHDADVAALKAPVGRDPNRRVSPAPHVDRAGAARPAPPPVPAPQPEHAAATTATATSGTSSPAGGV